MTLRTISSPAPTRGPAKEDATRLMASVAERVNTYFLHPCGIEEPADGFPPTLERLGRPVGERVQAPVDIGVGMSMHMVHGVEDLNRLLRRSP